MTNELIQKINNWNEYSEIIYGYSKSAAENFLKRLQVGIYNTILKNVYWFAHTPNADTLIQLEVVRKRLNALSNINEENYIVYSAIHDIKAHLQYIYYWHKAYNSNYTTNLNFYEQSPATKLEQQEFDTLYNQVINTNYTWQQAREIIKKLEDINIYENANFPHNIEEIKNIFFSQINCYYKNYPQKVKYSTNILNLNKTTNNLLNQLTANNIYDFIKRKRNCPYEEYVRQLLINTKITNIEQIKILLNSLLTPKKIIDLEETNIPQPYLTTIKKHYNFMFHNTSDLEYLTESIDILNTLITIFSNSKNKLYEITLINNIILISYGIIPIPLTEEILQLEDKDKNITIIEGTISQINIFNQEK